MNSSHSTNLDRVSPSGRSRDQLRAVRVIELARQQSPIKTPERISEEAVRIVDERWAKAMRDLSQATPVRVRSTRSWWQRFGDRMDADVLVEALVWGWVFLLCTLLIVGTLLAVRLGWVS